MVHAGKNYYSKNYLRVFYLYISLFKIKQIVVNLFFYPYMTV